MSRLVQLRPELLERLRGIRSTKKEVAEKLGVSEGTLNSLLDGSWSVIDRRLLERLLDELDCGPGELLQAVESPFFDVFRSIEQYEGRHRCHLSAPLRDRESAELVEDFLRDKAPDVTPFVDDVKQPSEFEGILEDGSCVVFGGPTANRLCGVALAMTFGLAGRGFPDEGAPFWFIDSRASEASSFLSPVGGPAIFVAHERLAFEASLSDTDIQADVRDARDVAVVVIDNRLLASGRRRKLITLAGTSRIGTLAAAHALVEDYRDIEPLQRETCAWGVIEARYTKLKGTKKRQLKGFKWLMRVGGRNPLKATQRKGAHSADLPVVGNSSEAESK